MENKNIKKFYQQSAKPFNYVPNDLVDSDPTIPPVMSGLMRINPDTGDIWVSAGNTLVSDWKLITGGGGGGGGVSSIDVNGGTGISVSPAGPITTSGTFTVTNTAPDQTVTFVNGTGISVTGLYPNFTITNSAPGVTYTASNGIVQNPANNFELGRSSLAATADFSASRFINTGANRLSISGTNNNNTPGFSYTDPVLQINNTHIGANNATAVAINYPGNDTSLGNVLYLSHTGGGTVVGINCEVNSFTYSVAAKNTGFGGGLLASSVANSAILAFTNQNNGFSPTVPAIVAQAFTPNTSGISTVLRLIKTSLGATPQNVGAGVLMDFAIQTTDFSNPSAATVDVSWLNATLATRSAKYNISVVNNGSLTSRMEIYGADIIRLSQNIPGPYASDVAASAAGVPQFALYRDATSNVKICQV
jgi:hypothetical protein